VSEVLYSPSATQTLARVDGATSSINFIAAWNAHATSAAFLQLFGSAAAIVGTTVPMAMFPLPAGASGYLFGDNSPAYINEGGSGLWYAVTATPTGAGAPPAVVSLNIGYS